MPKKKNAQTKEKQANFSIVFYRSDGARSFERKLIKLTKLSSSMVYNSSESIQNFKCVQCSWMNFRFHRCSLFHIWLKILLFNLSMKKFSRFSLLICTSFAIEYNLMLRFYDLNSIVKNRLVRNVENAKSQRWNESKINVWCRFMRVSWSCFSFLGFCVRKESFEQTHKAMRPMRWSVWFAAKFIQYIDCWFV